MCEASACVGTRYIAVNVIKISQPTNLLPLLPTAPPPPPPPPLSIFVVAVLIIIIITNTTRFFLVAEVVGFFLFVAPGGVLKK